MKRDQRDVSAVFLLYLGSAFVCFVAGCTNAPQYYWAKSGVSQEQIRKDNFFCADMTAEKPPAYSRGSPFYYASLDQPAYQACMESLGYQKISEEELRRGVFAAASRPYLVQPDATRTLCQRVTGKEEGDIESCIRYMSMDPNKAVLPGAQFEHHSSSEPPHLTTVNDDMNACLRHDSNDSRHLKMAVSRNCGPGN